METLGTTPRHQNLDKSKEKEEKSEKHVQILF